LQIIFMEAKVMRTI